MDKEYWNKCWSLIAPKFGIDNNEPAALDEAFWDQVISNIKEVAKENNYLLFGILLRREDEMTEDVLLDLLFYLVIRNKRVFQLFKRDPDKYGSMQSSFTASGLLHLREYIPEEKYKRLKEDIHLEEMRNNLVHCTEEQLKSLFPQTFWNFDRRGHI
ncbi:MAG: hypothetical protein KDD10_28005 [Phaeodactylibacter sp.]|nr:hypothetical protein [Phaeodactylibacter sp.]MCB9297254.1 hypothetical protein [Lewinellaceae bacterium]